MRLSHVAAAAALALFFAGCAELLRVEAPVAPPAEFPDGYYQQALKSGKPVYRIDPAQSLIVIEVRRGGSLARLGHDHVVASHEVTGYIAPGEGRADLYVALARMQIDEPALRKEAGFDTQPTESDIEGTRSNMLTHVLEAEKFPFALTGRLHLSHVIVLPPSEVRLPNDRPATLPQVDATSLCASCTSGTLFPSPPS